MFLRKGVDMDKNVPPQRQRSLTCAPVHTFIFYHLEPDYMNFHKYKSINFGKLLPTPTCLDYVSSG